jgi:hypothetical protein
MVGSTLQEFQPRGGDETFADCFVVDEALRFCFRVACAVSLMMAVSRRTSSDEDFILASSFFKVLFRDEKAKRKKETKRQTSHPNPCTYSYSEDKSLHLH